MVVFLHGESSHTTCQLTLAAIKWWNKTKNKKRIAILDFIFRKKKFLFPPLRRHNQPDASFVFIKRRNRRLMKQHPFSGFFSRASRVEKKHANNSAKDNLTFVKYIQNVSLEKVLPVAKTKCRSWLRDGSLTFIFPIVIVVSWVQHLAIHF